MMNRCVICVDGGKNIGAIKALVYRVFFFRWKKKKQHQQQNGRTWMTRMTYAGYFHAISQPNLDKDQIDAFYVFGDCNQD